jgi:hypothetical protein
MKKAAVVGGLFALLFLGCIVEAQAGSSYSFGISFGVGPVVASGYYAYPAYPAYPYVAYPSYYYPGYYAYPAYPAYRTYVVPRYYGNGAYRYYDSQYNNHNKGNRGVHGAGKSNPRSKSGRWRY